MTLRIDNEKNPYRERILNTAFDVVKLSQVREIVTERIKARKPGYMVSLNLDIDILLENDAEFRQSHQDATLILMDSQPLYNLARTQGIAIEEKLSGSDLMGPVCGWAAEEGWSVFILGGMPGVPELASDRLQSAYPGLKVAGVLSPDYGFEKDTTKLSEVLSRVSHANPDILFVCLGSPKSEKLVHEHLSDFGTLFAFSVGAAVDFWAGNVKRAPKWMSDHSLEWLFRFFQEPKRLFKRYFINSWKFLGIVRRYWTVGGAR